MIEWIQTLCSIGGLLVVVWAYVSLKRMGKARNILKILEEINKERPLKAEIYDTVMDMLLNALEDEELGQKLSEIINKFAKDAAKGAVGGAMPKMKPMDLIALVALGLAQKYGLIPQQAAQPAQSTETVFPA